MSGIVDCSIGITWIPLEEPGDYHPWAVSPLASLVPGLLAVAVAVAAERKRSHFLGVVSSSAGHSRLEPDFATHEVGTGLGLAKLREGCHLTLGRRQDWFDRGCSWKQLDC